LHENADKNKLKMTQPWKDKISSILQSLFKMNISSIKKDTESKSLEEIDRVMEVLYKENIGEIMGLFFHSLEDIQKNERTKPFNHNPLLYKRYNKCLLQLIVY